MRRTNTNYQGPGRGEKAGVAYLCGVEVWRQMTYLADDDGGGDDG